MLEFFFVLLDFLQTTSGNRDHKHCNLGQSDLNYKTRVLEFFFVVVDFLQTTSRNQDHKHCNLGLSDLNCKTRLLEFFFVLVDFLQHNFKTSKSQVLLIRSVRPKLHK